MTEEKEYLVPDYYPDFSCKMGACRAACCTGWPISLAQEDYFRLLGVACSQPLRARLDCALHVRDRPTPEAYAEINPRFDGDCPLRLPDGRCAVHAELGPEALATVCRLYPRGVRLEGAAECSCANSCEAVAELLLAREAPLSFRPLRLRLDVPAPRGRTVFFETVGREQEIRLWLIRLMQDRALSLPLRLARLGDALDALEQALNARDAKRVDALLTGRETLPLPQDAPVTEAQLRFGLGRAEAMLTLVDERSRSVRRYGREALAWFAQDERAFDRYLTARAHFAAVLPRWETGVEQLLVNHMFFSRFPFQDRPESLGDEYIALCAVYGMLRFLGLGWMARRESPGDFADVAAAAFRLIDHTAFDRYAAHLLRRLECGERERLHAFVSL